VLTDDPIAARTLLAAAQSIVAERHLSSAHATFVAETQLDWFREAGWLIREGVQFHWANRNYACFDDFLDALSSRKRKNIRKERATAQAGLEIVQLSGCDLTEAHWDAFWVFYQDTGARKWGTPYLTRAFFSEIGQTMADRILLFLALRDGRPIAGALNFIGDNTLYGRYWGCTEDVPCLHFELCYYQAIEAAIARGLERVEAGAQGEHQLARGYVALPTWSAHYIPNPAFRNAVADFVESERRAMDEHIAFLGEMAPFKRP
jgi:predicted N-acyltransferase